MKKQIGFTIPAISAAALIVMLLSAGCSHNSTVGTAAVATVSTADRIKQIQADPGIPPAAKDHMIQQLTQSGSK